MAGDLNRCEFIGRLGKDPEVRYFPNGDPVCNFSIAVGERWVDKASGEKKEKTTWVEISAHKKLAEICGQYLTKGSRIFCAGKFDVRKWTDKEGKDRYSTSVVIHEMQMLDTKKRDESEAPPAQRAAPAEAAEKPAEVPFEDDDIPF